MISDRNMISALATLLSIPPILAAAAAVNRWLPPAPRVPSVVAANDRRTDALNGHAKTATWSGFDRSLAKPSGAASR